MESLLGDVLALISAFAGGVAYYCFSTAGDVANDSIKRRKTLFGPPLFTALFVDEGVPRSHRRIRRLFLWGYIASAVFAIFFIAFVYVSLNPAGFAAGFVFWCGVCDRVGRDRNAHRRRGFDADTMY